VNLESDFNENLVKNKPAGVTREMMEKFLNELVVKDLF